MSTKNNSEFVMDYKYNTDQKEINFEDILDIKLNIIKGDFNKYILMTENGQSEIRSFGGHLKLESIKERCIKALLRVNSTDINILSSTHFTDDGRFFNIFSREIYVDGKWQTYWLKDINTDLKTFII